MSEVASVARATGLSIQAWKPIVRGASYVPRGELVDPHLAEKARDYTHTIKARGGWWSAEFSFTGNRQEIEEWYEQGLGRHVEVFNATGRMVWAGFVDSVTITMGTLTATVGPLLEVANRCSVIYTPILYTDVWDPESHVTTGEQTQTTIADDASSQGKYGILEEVLSGGEMLDDGTTDEAEQYRDSFIAEHRLPATDERLLMERTEITSVRLEMRGYVRFLQRYVVSTSNALTCTISTKLEDALGDDPNGLFSTDYRYMEANAFLVNRDERKERNAWTVIEEMVNLGDASDNRYVFGVYGGQQFHYRQVPTMPKYQHRLVQSMVQVETFGVGVRVEPWNVQAGEWLFLSDFLAGMGGTHGVPMREDHRYVFIEEVKYTAPMGIEIVGGHYGTLGQWLAKKGLGV